MNQAVVSLKCGLCVFTLALLGACANPPRMLNDREMPRNVERSQEAWSALRRPQTEQEFLVEDARPVISTKSVPLSRDAALPPHIKKVVFRFPGRHALPTLTERISREIGIPIVLTPDALRPASTFAPGAGTGGTSGGASPSPMGGPLNAASAAFPTGPDLGGLVVNPSDYQRTFELNYTGSLAGLFDNLAAVASLNWKYEDGRVVFYRVQTRSFVIKTLPGGFSVTADMGGSSGGGSGGSGGTSGSGGSGGGGGGGGVGQLESKTDFWPGIEAGVKAMLSSAGRMSLDANTGILVVTDGNEVMSLVEQYVDQMNRLMMRQITLEVEVVSVDVNASNANGIDWSVVGKLANGTITFAAPGAPDSAGTPFSVRLSSPGGGRSALISALQTFGNVTTAYSGVVVTTNRTPAPILVNNTQSYVSKTSPAVVTTTAVVSGAGLTPGQVSTGIGVVLLPLILDSNQVLMQCIVRISSLKELVPFTSGEGATKQTVQLPNVDSFSLVQRMVIPAGQTMVIMGYDQARNGSSTSGPFSSLTTGVSGSGNKQSLVVMITPRLSDL